MKLSVAKGYIAQDRQGLYGRAIIDETTQDTLTYEINKPLNATAVIPIYVYPTENADPKDAVLRGTVSVIPASNVYYEETVLTSGKDNANGSTSWTSGGTATASNQALEVAGTNTHVHWLRPNLQHTDHVLQGRLYDCHHGKTDYGIRRAYKRLSVFHV